MGAAASPVSAGSWSKHSGSTTIDGILPRLIEPEVLMPSQFYDRFRASSVLEGERRLMLAVLEDAVACYQKNVVTSRSHNRRLFEDAEEWFFDEDSSWPFSFEAICVVLGYDVDYFRSQLNRWKANVLARDPGDRAKVGRIRLRAARRHKILANTPRKRNRKKAEPTQAAVA